MGIVLIINPNIQYARENQVSSGEAGLKGSHSTNTHLIADDDNGVDDTFVHDADNSFTAEQEEFLFLISMSFLITRFNVQLFAVFVLLPNRCLTFMVYVCT